MELEFGLEVGLEVEFDELEAEVGKSVGVVHNDDGAWTGDPHIECEWAAVLSVVKVGAVTCLGPKDGSLGPALTVCIPASMANKTERHGLRMMR